MIGIFSGKLFVVSANLEEVGGIQVYTRKVVKTARSFGVHVETCQLRGLSIFRKAQFIMEFFWGLARLRPDGVYCSHIAFSPLCLFASLLFRTPYVIAVYGIEIEHPGLLQRVAFRRAEGVVYLFEKTRQVAEGLLKGRSHSFFHVPNSVDTERFFPGEKSAALQKKWNSTGKKVVFTLCRLSRSERDNKGYAKVLEVFPQILASVPDSVYIMAGSGDDREAMMMRARELGVEKNVLFPGGIPEEEKVDYYNLCDVFVYPSKREGFPAIVLLEALACGKPVVAGNQPGSDPFQKTFGLVVDPDHSASLADATISLLKSGAGLRYSTPDLLSGAVRDLYGEEAYRKYVRNFLNSFIKK